MAKLSINKKNKLYIILICIICLLLSGCGLPTEYDFSFEKDFYSKNKSEIKELFNFIESNNLHDIYKDHYDEKYHYTINGTEENLLLSDQYKDIEQKVIDLDISYLGKGKDDNIFLETYRDGWFFKSYKDIEDIECPYTFPANDDELKLLNIEKEVDGDKIHFIDDHRKDKETTWKKMYYRIDVEKLDDYIYVYELQTKYPWTSIFGV